MENIETLDPMLQGLQMILDMVKGMTWGAIVIAVLWILFQTATYFIPSYYLYKVVNAAVTNFTRMKETVAKEKSRPKVSEVEIKGMTITMDGTYDRLVSVLRKFRNFQNTAGGTYLHSKDVEQLEKLIDDYIKSQQSLKGKK